MLTFFKTHYLPVRYNAYLAMDLHSRINYKAEFFPVYKYNTTPIIDQNFVSKWGKLNN